MEILLSLYACERRADGRSPADLFLWDDMESDGSADDDDDSDEMLSPNLDVLRVLTPESIASTDNDGKTIWEYFCSEAIPNHIKATSNVEANAWLSDAALCLIEAGAYEIYERQAGTSGFLRLCRRLDSAGIAQWPLPMDFVIYSSLALNATQHLDQVLNDALIFPPWNGLVSRAR